jgi:hypothetical protein
VKGDRGLPGINGTDGKAGRDGKDGISSIPNLRILQIPAGENLKVSWPPLPTTTYAVLGEAGVQVVDGTRGSGGCTLHSPVPQIIMVIC